MMMLFFMIIKRSYITSTISDNLLNALVQEGFERIRLVPFRPTCENFAPYFYYEMKAKGYDVECIKVWETEINSCEYREK